MASPWGKVENVETINFADIMSEEYARSLQKKEMQKCGQQMEDDLAKQSIGSKEMPKDPGLEHRIDLIPEEVIKAIDEDVSLARDAFNDNCCSDELIAKMLQAQFDQEYNQELKRTEDNNNKKSKVRISLANFFKDCDEEEENEECCEENYEQNDWDVFETNEKKFDGIPKCGFKIDEEGEMITKHDPDICGVRNACRVMSFPPEFPTGDGAKHKMRLPNSVFNKLKSYSRKGKIGKMHDRKENLATAEQAVDNRTRMILYKLVNGRILEQTNGIISTGKEALILHADGDSSYEGDYTVPKECAIKIFRTTLNDFKQRDRYIKDDYRFKERFTKPNMDFVINMWAEKEMHNLKRMQKCGINCPSVVLLKKNILVMSFIGQNHNAAPKLKDAHLSDAELSVVYEDLVNVMYKLYNEANLVHADLSEYNILWMDDKAWIIDVAQAVAPDHPGALEFLMRDCNNIISFFKRRGVPNIYTKEQLFEYITSMNAESHNAAMLEKIHSKGASENASTSAMSYPFDLAWEKSIQDREQSIKHSIVEDVDSLKVLSISLPENDAHTK